MPKKKLLFVCIENSNRSQMAEAFAKIHGDSKIEALSAGSRPSGIVNTRAVTAMAELGYDLSNHKSNSIENLPDDTFEYLITMGCGDDCPFVPAKYREDWDIPDPRDLEQDEFNRIRDMIERKVKALLKTIREESVV